MVMQGQGWYDVCCILGRFAVAGGVLGVRGHVSLCPGKATATATQPLRFAQFRCRSVLLCQVD